MVAEKAEKDKKIKDIAYPVTKDFREKLQEKILQSYESGEDIIFEV